MVCFAVIVVVVITGGLPGEEEDDGADVWVRWRATPAQERILRMGQEMPCLGEVRGGMVMIDGIEGSKGDRRTSWNVESKSSESWRF
jgi:hypothetical protein